jgi:predicted nucleic acid-binding protein
MPVNLFIDTNILLSFYHFTSEDLEELKKLAVLINKNAIRLFLPEQVVHEFRRNRDAKIADALKRLRQQKIGLQFPQLCKDYAEYEKLTNLQVAYDQTHAALLSRVERDIAVQALKADKIIDGLFSATKTIATKPELVDRARMRMDLGNPPGKNGSLGDALNWETLLVSAPESESLHFVADDKDYASPLEAAAFNSFLLAEWEETKKTALVPYRRLSGFFKSTFPDIHLASEIEKDFLIRRLAASTSFANTHTLIAQLTPFSEFTAAQANAILSAVIANNQIGWIAADQDVREFLKNVMTGKAKQLDQEAVMEVQGLMGPERPQDDEIPF